jgi:hypothetical protein
MSAEALAIPSRPSGLTTPASSALSTLKHDASPMEKAQTAAQNEFASVLSQSMAARSGGAAAKAVTAMSETELDARAKQAAQDFVAVAFVQPILKNLRSSKLGGDLPPPLGPGPGEKQFRSLADTQVAKQLVKAGNWPLVNTLTRLLRSPRPDPKSPDAVKHAPALPGSPAFFRRHAEAAAAKKKAESRSSKSETHDPEHPETNGHQPNVSTAAVHKPPHHSLDLTK